MQISIQSLEVTYNQVPYRFIVKKVANNRNEVSFHCWAPEDHLQAKELIKNDVLLFEWDHQREELKAHAENPVSEPIRQAIQKHFSMERA